MNAQIINYSKRFVLPLWSWYLTGILALAITNIVTLEIPQLAKQIVNAIDQQNVTAPLQTTALLIIALGILQILIRSLSRILIFWPGRKLEAETKSYLFNKMIYLPQQFYLKFGMGDLISRLANDVGHLRVFFAFGALQVLNLGFLLLFTINKMLSVHTILTILCLTPLIIMLVIARVVMPMMQKFSKENQEAVAALTNKVTEAFVNVHIIQANAAEETFIKRTEHENDKVFNTNMKLIATRMVLFPLITLLGGLSQMVVLLYGGYLVLSNAISIGDILAFNVYIGFLTFPLTAVGMILAMFERAKTALERLNDIDIAQPETVLATESTPAPLTATTSAIIEIKALNYRYPISEESVQIKNTSPQLSFALKDINFAIAKGTKLGIYGAIGSGKTTLFYLMTRLWDPPPGTIFFKGQDILTIKPPDLRKHIGYALQTVHLFSESIAKNLQFGFDHASEDELIHAAKEAQIYDEITHFKDQWQTQIGEKGLRLSGGQKQRLSLARIFIRNPELILLDDVLSAVDHATEQKLINYINRVKCAALIASHRFSVLEMCDEVIYLVHGQIIDRGTFNQLAIRHPEVFVSNAHG